VQLLSFEEAIEELSFFLQLEIDDIKKKHYQEHENNWFRNSKSTIHGAATA
jgi:hypothetical protein